MNINWILIGISTITYASEVPLREHPNMEAKIIENIAESDDIEISLGPWLYITNHSKNISGWVEKKSFENTFKTRINYSERFSKSGKIDQIQHQHQKIMDLWRQQEALFQKTETLLNQFNLDGEDAATKVSDTKK
jgi:hypothetical protein